MKSFRLEGRFSSGKRRTSRFLILPQLTADDTKFWASTVARGLPSVQIPFVEQRLYPGHRDIESTREQITFFLS